MLRIAVCDDNRQMLDRVGSILSDYSERMNTPVTVDTYLSAIDLLDALRKNNYDILILDIIMPGFTGIQAAREIRRFNEDLRIIFLTSSREYAVDSYEVDAYYYLLKPVIADTLFPLLNRIVREIEESEPSCVIYTPLGIINLPFARIECLEVYNKHLVFHLSDGTQREIRGSLSDYENALLARKEFIKIHRSYILNMDYITSIGAGNIEVYRGKEFPVSRLLVKDIKDQYMGYMFSKDK